MITNAGRNALESYRVKRAIILAAGFGSRLVPITLNTPKPLIRIRGERIIDSLIDALIKAEIEEIYIVRGYLGEQFDQLLYKYPNIRFVENPMYDQANNISSVMCVRYMLQNAYLMEADLLLHNPKVIKKYHYTSNYLGFPVETSDDWCFVVKDGEILAFEDTPYLKRAEKIMQSKNVIVNIDMHLGEGQATAWGCDLTYDYVKINAEYTT
jgi:choline kinase